jgi:hypothetical protein
MKERKSAADAFPRRPWPGFVPTRNLGPRGLLTGAALSAIISSYWAISAWRADGWSVLFWAALAMSGTSMGVYYIREWRKARAVVQVEW